jgi:hypothetical protein
MLLVASLWQLEIVEISRGVSECGYNWPFDIGGSTCWWIARDFWFGASRYAGFTRRLSRQVESYRATLSQARRAVSGSDEMLYDYIIKHGGTISFSTASRELGMSLEEINASIARLRTARRIE